MKKKIIIDEMIKHLREKNKLTQDELGTKLSVSGKTISSWEKGRTEPNMGTIQLLADLFGVSTDVLIYGDEEDKPFQNLNDYLNIPLYNELCCGNGGFVEDNIIEYIPVPSNTLPLNAEYFCQKAMGDSMKDAGIYDGDLLIFLKTPYIENNDIGCFCIGENMATCKKYKYSNGIVTLLPMNSNYDPIIIDVTNENFRCLGRLKYSIRKY